MRAIFRRNASRSAPARCVDGRSTSVSELNATTASRSPGRSALESARLASRASAMGSPCIEPEVSTTSARLMGGRVLPSSGRVSMRMRESMLAGCPATTKRFAESPCITTRSGSSPSGPVCAPPQPTSAANAASPSPSIVFRTSLCSSPGVSCPDGGFRRASRESGLIAGREPLERRVRARRPLRCHVERATA